MIKKGIIYVILFLNLSCNHPKIVYNDYNYIKKIDKEYFTKGAVIFPENRLELFIIKAENGKLSKERIVNNKKEKLKDRASYLLNYNNDKLYVLFYKDTDWGAESQNVKIYYYDKDLKLKKFNDKEYIFDNNTDEKIENKVNGVSSIKYIINSNLYINFNEKGGFENDERIVKNEYAEIFDYDEKTGELYLTTGSEKNGKTYVYDIDSKKLRIESSNDNQKQFLKNIFKLDKENILYTKKNLLIKKNLRTKKEKILYKAYNEINNIQSLNKKNTLLALSVWNHESFINFLLRYINKWKSDHDVIYDLQENKVYMLETGNIDLIEKEEQLRLTNEIINYGLEKT